MRKKFLLSKILVVGLLSSVTIVSPAIVNADTPAAVGSAAVGSTSYGVPANAIFVAPNGNDQAAGTKEAPLKTVAVALNKATEGKAIVLRGGNYHEHIKIQKKGITIQSYPKETVYFDGSTAVTGWTKEGNWWVKNNWTAQFDSSPTFSKGKEDNINVAWRNINPNYQMAANPDQVWINNTPQIQVKDKNSVTASKFYVDYAAKKLYIGTDPTNKEVRASDVDMAMEIQAPDIKILGVGVVKYATSVPMMGTVRLDGAAANSKIENVVFADNATTGVSVSAKNVTLQNVTSKNNGMLGIHANMADGLVANKVSVVNNNIEHFNRGPIASGMKLTRAKNLKISNSEFLNNDGTGLWFDEDCVNMTIVNSNSSNNKKHGLVLELSSGAIVANNRFMDNTDGENISGTYEAGVLALSTDTLKIWNNTIEGSDLPLVVQQDNSRTTAKDRTWTNQLPADYPKPTWVVKNVSIFNNIIGKPLYMAGNAWGGVETIRDENRTAEQMGVTMNGNVYYRVNSDSRPTLIQWSTKTQGQKNWNNFTTLDAFKAASMQDQRSKEFMGTSPIDANGYASSSVLQSAGSIAVAVPSDIAAVTGIPTGSYLVGPYNGKVAPLPNPPVQSKVGNLDTVTNYVITGWAWNSNNPNTSINAKICIYDSNNKEVTNVTVPAKEFRDDIKKGGFGTGNYGFTYNIDWRKFAPGKYKVVAYGIDGSKSNLLPNEKNFTVEPIRGNMDTVTPTTITGWAWKPNAPHLAINVKIVIVDGNNKQVFETTVPANQYRSDIKNLGYGTGNYSFIYKMDWSKFPSGTYKITGYAVDGSSVSPKLNELTYKK